MRLRIPFSRSLCVGLFEVVGIAVVYYFTGKLGLLVALPPGIATAIWPPSGVALAAVVLRGHRVGLGIWLGSFCVNLPTLYTGATFQAGVVSVGVVGTIALASTFQALLGAFLIRRFIGAPNWLERTLDVLKFVGIELLACMVSPSLGVTGLCVGGFTPW